MAGSPSRTTAKRRARVAGMAGHRPADDPEFVQAQRDLAASNLEDHIRRVLTQPPRLSDEQRINLAELLRPVHVRPSGRSRAVAAKLAALDEQNPPPLAQVALETRNRPG